MGNLSGIGWPGVIVLVIAGLLLFGPKRLPELGESVGKMFAAFKKAVDKDESQSKEEKDSNENKKD